MSVEYNCKTSDNLVKDISAYILYKMPYDKLYDLPQIS